MTYLYPTHQIEQSLKTSYSQLKTTVHFLQFDEENVSPNIYGEIIGKHYGNPKKVKAHLETDPTDIRMEELGWNKETVHSILRIPFILLLESELAEIQNEGTEAEKGVLLFKPEDRVFIPSLETEGFDGVYSITQIHRKELFIKGSPTFVWVGVRKFTVGS